MVPLGHEQLSAANLSSSIGLQSIPTGAQRIWVQANGSNVRMRLDGQAVTASTGIAIIDQQPPIELDGLSINDLSNLRFILESGSPTLDVVYFGIA